LRAHEVYLSGLGDAGMSDPEPFLRGMAEQAGKRFGGRLAVTFELFEW
jgi:hypothetical protein